MLVKIEAGILIFPGTGFHFPSTSMPPRTFFRLCLSPRHTHTHTPVSGSSNWYRYTCHGLYCDQEVAGPIHRPLAAVTTLILIIIWYSITHSLFHSRLITYFPANPSDRSPSFFFFGIHYMDSPDCLLLLLSISVSTF